MDTGDGAARFFRAVEISRAASTPSEREPGWDALHEAASDGVTAFHLAFGQVTSTDPDIRSTACDLLGIVGEFHHDLRNRAGAALLGVATMETHPDVVWSLARALGRIGDPAALPLLIGFTRNPDAGIRREAATALTSILCEYPDDAGLDALVRLCADADPEVRNWATFGVGWQLAEDSPTIREALWARTRDTYSEAREEGIRGLARRRDPRAVPLVAELLAARDAHRLTFDAAAFLASPDLVTSLVSYNIVDFGVAEALLECDPVNRRRRDDLAWALFITVHELRPELPITLFSERFELGLVLAVEPIGEPATAVYRVEYLLARADDDPVRAAEWVAQDIPVG